MKILILTIIITLITTCSYGLGFNEQARFTRVLEFALLKAPEYVWGGRSILDGGDCSGILTEAAEWSGFPVLRTTSYNMAHGTHGWNSIKINRDIYKDKDGTLIDGNAEPGDLAWWTFKMDRPYGHVAAKLNKKSFAHASFSKNAFVLEIIGSSMGGQIILTRRLTFGDKRYQ